MLQRSRLRFGEVLLRLARYSGAVDRRIEKNRVFAHDAPTGPCHLDKEVQKWLDHGVAGRDIDHSATGRVFYRREFELGELKRPLNTRALELLGAGQLHLHAFQIPRLRGYELDTRAQRLVEGRIDLNIPQTECPGTGGDKQKESSQGDSPASRRHMFHTLIKSCPTQLRGLKVDPTHCVSHQASPKRRAVETVTKTSKSGPNISQ